MDTSSSLFRSAKHFFAGTVLSRFSGLLRDVFMAYYFGSTSEIAAFMVAYRLTHLFRRLMGEGNLQAGFVPHFELLRAANARSAFLFYRDTSLSLALLLLIVVIGMEGVLWIVLQFATPSWEEVIRLAMWMAPGLFFICLSALNSALLQCQKKYFAPAAAPILFNVIWVGSILIGSVLSICSRVQFLSVGVVIAFGLQWIATSVRVRCELKKELALVSVKRQIFSSEWRGCIKSISLGMIGIGAMQINSTLDAVFARLADLSGPAYLWYAIRLQQLPLALIGIALSGALLPPLARAIQEGAFDRYQQLLMVALRCSASLAVPCTFALFALGASGIDLLYGRGDFTFFDLRETLFCLWGYGIGLTPAVFLLLFSAGHYAKKSYKTPVLASLASIVIHIAFNALFIFVLDWGSISIALSTSISAALNCLFLLRGYKIEGAFFLYLIKLTGSGFFAFIATVFLGRWCGDMTLALCQNELMTCHQGFSVQLLQFCTMVGFYGVIFFTLTRRLIFSNFLVNEMTQKPESRSI